MEPMGIHFWNEKERDQSEKPSSMSDGIANPPSHTRTFNNESHPTTVTNYSHSNLTFDRVTKQLHKPSQGVK